MWISIVASVLKNRNFDPKAGAVVGREFFFEILNLETDNGAGIEFYLIVNEILVLVGLKTYIEITIVKSVLKLKQRSSCNGTSEVPHM